MGKLETPALLTPSEVAALYRVDPKTVTRWANQGKFPPGTVLHTPGGQRRFRENVIRALLNGTSGTGGGETILCAGGQHAPVCRETACTCACHRPAPEGTPS